MKTAGAIRALAMTAMFIWIAGSGISSAQQWEYVYGSSGNQEDGKFRVVPVTGDCADPSCCTGGDGYIAVGTWYPTQGAVFSDVHVVRTDNNGARIWEYTYDITGNNDWDYGWSIIELSDGSGFVITGETEINDNPDVFLLKIDCNGGVVWSRTYGGPVPDGGRDLIEATTGSQSAGTSAGDIVIAGYTLGPGPFSATPDGYLLRTTSNGTLIWDRMYNYRPTVLGPGDFEFFHSLAELTPVESASTGDIIAVGFTAYNNQPHMMQALAVRVNGNNGTIGAAPQGMGTYGLANAVDQFWSVIELQRAADTSVTSGQPNVVITGDYSGTKIYAVKLNGGDPTIAPLVERTISTTTTGTSLWGRTVREITFAPGSGSVNQWQLVVTGTIVPASGITNALLLSLAPNNLAPGALAVQYGGSGNEQGWSVYPVAAVGGRTFGFILCGHSTTNWGPTSGAQDMYLIKTDGFGATDCESSFTPSSTTVSTHVDSVLIEDDIDLSEEQETEETLRQWGLEVCPVPPGYGEIHIDRSGGFDISRGTDHPGPGLLSNPVRKNSEDIFNPNVAGGAKPRSATRTVPGEGGALTVYPNPVKVGDPMRIACPAGNDVVIAVTNTAGEIVTPEMKPDRSEKGEALVRTDGWPAGVYLITVIRDGVQSTIRVAVVD